MCRKTCKFCCEDPRYNCKDDANHPLINRTELQSQNRFGTASLKSIIVQYCPATCAMCNGTGTAGVCKDEKQPYVT
ncbi:unnamed protein product [Enterobius vermicularis]|uniref:ShKT domain-containing protein n=1 Tax=Enterobius vermicularis TaxID=51028 RepID=A0A0N4UTZ5_ENTVE|nr:unnamed protein product [Enterobius vermicularis]